MILTTVDARRSHLGFLRLGLPVLKERVERVAHVRVTLPPAAVIFNPRWQRCEKRVQDHSFDQYWGNRPLVKGIVHIFKSCTICYLPMMVLTGVVFFLSTIHAVPHSRSGKLGKNKSKVNGVTLLSVQAD